MKLRFWQLDLKLTYTWTIARSAGTNIFKVVMVELSDDNGIVALGEASPVRRYNETTDTVMAFYQKLDAAKLSFDDIPGSMKYLDSVAGENMAAKSGINIALVDGAAQKAKKPIYDYFGLGFKDRHHITSFTIGIDTPEIVRKKVVDAEQYPVLKLKVGVADDKANMAALRAVAPDKWVRVDANEGWKTKEHALETIEWLAQDKRIQFIEQPMPAATDPKDIAWLKARSPLPIFADESYHTAKDVALCAECYHGVNVKLCKTGGLSGGFEALQAARKAGLKTMIGCMIETSVLISAAAHLAELTDYLDIDGNILITNDPYKGVTSEKGILSFASAPGSYGLRVATR